MRSTAPRFKRDRFLALTACCAIARKLEASCSGTCAAAGRGERRGRAGARAGVGERTEVAEEESASSHPDLDSSRADLAQISRISRADLGRSHEDTPQDADPPGLAVARSTAKLGDQLIPQGSQRSVHTHPRTQNRVNRLASSGKHSYFPRAASAHLHTRIRTLCPPGS